ncbi:hypothetical protein Hypma_005092 [Hypsizygus marmoreus]|uniref:Protein kinase domain-containing protein n=1 Tax=Hypsizygus marmoreus TaxID=39966 RepID=A0A369K0V4_HYPMA|nr:hypothetical protein Hypma_005092 [Hypsizygus marmoreus]
MVTLRVENFQSLVPFDTDDWVVGPGMDALTIVDPDPIAGKRSFRVKAMKILHDGGKFLNIRTSWLDVEDFKRTGLETIVLKMTTKSKAFDNFMMIFDQRLSHLQGRVIPELIGVFQGEALERQLHCVIMEDCGDPLNDVEPLFAELYPGGPKSKLPFRFQPHNVRLRVFEQLSKFHLVKVHVNFNESHVLAKDKDYRICTLDCGPYEIHECSFVSGELSSILENPHWDSHCTQLVNLAQELDVWSPAIPNVSIFKDSYDSYTGKLYPAQEIVDELFKEDRLLGQYVERWKILKWLRALRKYQLDNNVQDHKSILALAAASKPKLTLTKGFDINARTAENSGEAISV